MTRQELTNRRLASPTWVTAFSRSLLDLATAGYPSRAAKYHAEVHADHKADIALSDVERILYS